MKTINVENAVGVTLCHDITAMRTGFKGVAFPKGHVVTEEDIPKLLDIGKKTIYLWEEEEGMLHENDAAERLSRITDVEGAHFVGPSEGKMMLIADRPGMFRVNKELLEQINRIGEITIPCLPDHYPVRPGARIAAMRVVPLVIEEWQIRDAERLAAGKQLFELLPYQEKKVGLVITGSEVYTGRIEDKFEAVARRKLESFPAEIIGVELCDDDTEMIAQKTQALIDRGADLLLFSGGMSVDPDDVTPTAIRELGADIICYGLPSQPGNMSLIAYKDDVTLLGVPGAAMAHPTTVLDVVLPQVFTGARFTLEELKRLGDGGLCQFCDPCHYPNCTFGRY